jgi:hypothetical protein
MGIASATDLGVLDVAFRRRRHYVWVVSSPPDREDPLAIEVGQPAHLQGVTVARYRHDGRLHTAVKDRPTARITRGGRGRFYDQSQLNRDFKRIVGLTPGQYARALA